jgi:hypothetical protein
MPYRWNGYECDTADELLRLKERVQGKDSLRSSPSSSLESSGLGFCSNPGHRDDCSGRKDSCAPASTRCCGKNGDCNCDRLR